MERRQDGHWLTVWKAPLANDVAPVDAVVSNAGVSMTFDNWHGLGWGDDALVFYSADRSEEHTSELQSLMRISYAVFCLKKTNITNRLNNDIYITTCTQT